MILLKVQEYMKCFLEINQYLIKNNLIVRTTKNADSACRKLNILNFDRKINFSSKEYCSNLGSKLNFKYSHACK